MGYALCSGFAPGFYGAKSRTRGVAQCHWGILAARQSLASHPAAKPERRTLRTFCGRLRCNSAEIATAFDVIRRFVRFGKALQRFAQKVIQSRRCGFAVGCEARLCLAAKIPMTMGSAL